ncbi:FAD-dependent oxidoreductase [Flagellimonas sp. 2504JD4-2]
MIKKGFESARNNKTVQLQADLVVVGGGLAGVCAAIVAARDGLKVILVQDRPVLGGNASSEVRLWALGATSHMGNNNRWSREGGLINEILLDNLKRNKDGNPLIFDTILLEKVYQEDNITLLLNTGVYETIKVSKNRVEAVRAFNSQNSTSYRISAPFFCDASGDGIVGFQAGASFRMGAETMEEFDELFAPNIEDYGNLLGHSLYFYTKDAGKPIKYIPPAFAIDNAAELPRIKNYQLNEHGCKLWWVEYGGRLDTVHQSEDIKFELWKVIYGIWDYVKNSGKYPEAENLTLEWVGTIPGKRESRRFEGDFMLTQKDIVEQRDYYDRVAFGGWAMDLHPADGVYSKHNSCTQWHSKGVYSIPYRCYYSKDIDNLFLAGRIISASHVAFGSSRVMLTCAHGAQVVGKAAKICRDNGFLPKDLAQKDKISQLQLALNRDGQSIPRLEIPDTLDLVQSATISSSSQLELGKIKSSDEWLPLMANTAKLLPLNGNKKYNFGVSLKASESTSITLKLKKSLESTHFTPNVEIASQEFTLSKGVQNINFQIPETLDDDCYAYVCFMKNNKVEVQMSTELYSGTTTVFQKKNEAVSNNGNQSPPEGIGVDSFEFWTPERNHRGIAMEITPAIPKYSSENIKSGNVRPTPDGRVNCWSAAMDDNHSKLVLNWDKKIKVQLLKLFFDSDYDNALESILMTHPKETIDFIVKDYRVFDDSGVLIFEKKDNHQAINEIELNDAIFTRELSFEFEKPQKEVPVTVFKISAFAG